MLAVKPFQLRFVKGRLGFADIRQRKLQPRRVVRVKGSESGEGEGGEDDDDDEDGEGNEGDDGGEGCEDDEDGDNGGVDDDDN